MASDRGRQNVEILWLLWLLSFCICLALLHYPPPVGEAESPAADLPGQEKPTLARDSGLPPASTGGHHQPVRESGRQSLALWGPHLPGLLQAPDLNASSLAINNRGQVTVEAEAPGEMATVDLLDAASSPDQGSSPTVGESEPLSARLEPDPEAVQQKIAAKQQEVFDEAAFKATLSRYEAEMASQQFPRRANQLPEGTLSDLIKKYSRKHGVDARLVWAVMRHESGFNARAVSPKGAMGLMQLIPSTAALMGVSDPFDIEENINGGVKYLRLCLNKFNNNVVWALAAYNAGPDNVSKYQGIPPFAETRNYVLRVMRDYTGNTISIPLVALAGGGTRHKLENDAGLAAAPEESGLDWKVPEAKFKISGPTWKTPLKPTIILAKIPSEVRQNPEVARLIAKHSATAKLLR